MRTARTIRLAAFAVLLLAVDIAASEAPALPKDVTVLQVADHVVAGKGWLVDTGFGRRSYQLHGSATMSIDLTSLSLKPGRYRLGLLARTGTRYAQPTAQVSAYSLAMRDAAGALRSLASPQLLSGPSFRPLLDRGERGSWGNWFGAIGCPQPVTLAGGEHLVVTNRDNHGGVVAVWLRRVEGLDGIGLALETGVPQGAFIAGQEPMLRLSLDAPESLTQTEAKLRVRRLDLLTGAVEERAVTVRPKPGATVNEPLRFPHKAGIFRVEASLADAADPGLGAARCLYACAPARWARDLPVDWPLATHVADDIPPLPGFRWYRYFAGWHRVNPAPGEFHWDEFDKVVAGVRAVGGKMLIAGDGVPLWTTKRGKAGMSWAKEATAWPPDDWSSQADYLKAMIARYADEAGTLAALELCNEANTRERWLGTPAQLVEQARVFHAAAAAAPKPIAVVGLAVSAGDQRGFVKDCVAAGMLDHVDQVSAHWYEELMSFEAETPINSLPRHVTMLTEPMRAKGPMRPMINSECGVEFVPRDGDRLVPQEELNRAAEVKTGFDRQRPWLVDGHWRAVSERRAAATYVSGTVMLLALGVERSFTFSHYDFLIEGVPSLPWVALGCLGSHLEGVDYHTVEALDARVVGSAGGDREPKALAYRLGRPDGRQVIVAWAYLSDTSVGRSKHWQPWLDPKPVKIHCNMVRAIVSDLYGRGTTAVTAADGVLRIQCGEEPVFLVAP